jgi:hypothetical protein
MEKIEKRLTDLSGALAHNYPEIKLTKCHSRSVSVNRWTDQLLEKVGIR